MEETTQFVREAPEIEAYKLGLLESAKKEADRAFDLPQYQRAGMSPDQLDALATGRAGIGAFQPFINQGAAALDLGQAYGGQGYKAFLNADEVARSMSQYANAAGAGLGALGQGVTAYTGAAQGYDPTSVSAYMNPYQQSVIDEAMKQIDRQGQLQQQGLNAQAVRSGAFGGSREGIQRQELNRNLAETKNAAILSALQQGYGAAQAQAQQAFEQQQQRQLQQGQGLQNAAAQYANIAGVQSNILGSQAGLQQGLGQGIGALGTQMGNMGIQQAALGAQQQQLGQSDVNFLYNLGQTQQADLQSQYDAARANAMQKEMQTRQNLAFLSDIYKGAPSTQMAVTQQTQPTPSPFQQIAGLATGTIGTAAAARSAGIV